MNDVESDTGPWAAVPAWVLDSGVSPRAVMLYALFSLYADGGATGNGATTRTRRKLAARMDCSVDTLDRAVTELESICALARIPTKDAMGDQGPNRWKVFRVRSGSRENAATGDRANAAPEETRPPLDPDPQKPLVRDEDFKLFYYSAYPRPTAPKAARKAWDKAIKKTDPAVIIAAALRYRDDPNLPETQYIPYPSKWLNDGRWEDGPLPQRKPTSGTPQATTPESHFTHMESEEAWLAHQETSQW